MDRKIVAEPYDAGQCPICKVWVYLAAGPFAEDNDPTKPLADYNHWAREHATPEELSGSVIGFPFFSYNEQSVEAVLEGTPSVKRVMLGSVEVARGIEEGSAPWRFWHRVRLTAPLAVPTDAEARAVRVAEGLVDFAPAYELREI